MKPRLQSEPILRFVSAICLATLTACGSSTGPPDEPLPDGVAVEGDSTMTDGTIDSDDLAGDRSDAPDSDTTVDSAIDTVAETDSDDAGGDPDEAADTSEDTGEGIDGVRLVGGGLTPSGGTLTSDNFRLSGRMTASSSRLFSENWTLEGGL